MTAGSSRWVTTTKRVVGQAVDAVVLGAVPEDKDAVAEALENGRTVIQGWCRASAFGHSVTNGGCVRMPAAMRRHVQICDRRVNESPDGRCESRLAMSYGTGPESRQRLGTAH